MVGLVFPSRWILAIIGLALLVSAGLGLHHAGVEQHWWPGPTECTSGSSGAGSVAELKAMLLKEKVVQCDEIAWKFLGMSMAAYNALLSLIAGISVLIVSTRPRHAL
jgi:disulfide bond formation protein DsbB